MIVNQDDVMVTVKFGYYEIRTWVETEFTPSGELKFIGMGSKTEYDGKGSIVAHTVKPTGVIGRMR